MPLSKMFTNKGADFQIGIDHYYKNRKGSMRFSADLNKRDILGSKEELLEYMKNRYQDHLKGIIEPNLANDPPSASKLYQLQQQKQISLRKRELGLAKQSS